MPDAPIPSQLAATINQLYTLAGQSTTPDDKRAQLILQAHDLRGDLITLVTAQLDQAKSQYQDALKSLSDVSDSITAAQHDISKLQSVVTGAAALASSIDSLLKSTSGAVVAAAKIA
jgi:hypothetical protein